jgi:hypothetical protein
MAVLPLSRIFKEKMGQTALVLMSPGTLMATRIMPTKAIDLRESTVAEMDKPLRLGEKEGIRIAKLL